MGNLRNVFCCTADRMWLRTSSLLTITRTIRRWIRLPGIWWRRGIGTGCGRWPSTALPMNACGIISFGILGSMDRITAATVPTVWASLRKWMWRRLHGPWLDVCWRAGRGMGRTWRSLVAIELTIGEFDADYAGKRQLYLTALDEQVKLSEEKTTIGLIICRSKDNTFVEYALKLSSDPIGASILPESEGIIKHLRLL